MVWPSHPTRVRGLKPPLYYTHKSSNQVAPHAGAWIETNEKDEEDE